MQNQHTQQKKQRAEYMAAGMSEEDIQAMYEFDLAAFNSKRKYCKHAYYAYDTALGKVGICSDSSAVTSLRFEELSPWDGRRTADKITDEAARQLEDYLAGTRQRFDLPINPAGTAFQMSIWHGLQTIPYGETRSYAQVAKMVGNPGASRAVGMANNKNPIFIIIPCHRVIGSDGALVGYAGGLEIK